MSSLPPPTRNELIGYCAMQGVLQKQLLAEVVNLLRATVSIQTTYASATVS